MFSVVIPVYNHGRYLRQAVFSALHSPLVTEVLLLDDGSRDDSREVAARLVAASDGRLRDITPSAGGNRGAACRLNELVEAAKSEWIAVLNSDDVFVRGRFEKIAAQPSLSEFDFVFGYLLFMDERGALTGAKRGPSDPGVPFPAHFQVERMVKEGRLLDLLGHQNFLGTTSNMIFRKSLHHRIGGFSDYRYIHDWDFGLRALRLGSPLYLHKFLTAYRFHSANTIAEGQEKVNSEARTLFARLLTDFPDLMGRSEFASALENNANGVRIPRMPKPNDLTSAASA